VPRGTRGTAAALYEQIKAAILDGRLAPGTRLPPTRRSASFLGVSRNTAAEIYERLTSDGLVVTRRGSGSYVAQRARGARAREARPSASPSDSRLNDFWTRPEVSRSLRFWQERAESTERGAGPAIDFRPGIIDPRLFPFATFRRVLAQQLRRLENRPPRYKSPQGNQGNFHLRDAITRHISLTRAVGCAPEDVIITSGAQQAFDLLARVLVKPQQTVVAIEDPGYPPMRVAFAAAGARLVPVGVDAEGLRVDQLPSDARVICVCPSHQFPLGVTMSKRRRQALVAFARRQGAVIIEDDYDGEFRYDGKALEALRSSEVADVVFYVGTFSKCMLPSLRLGFIVASPWAMATLVAAKNALDWHCSTPLQLGVAGFISQGHLRRHVGRLRAVYQQRRRLLLELLQGELGAWLEPIPSTYGMHVAAFVRGPIDLERVTASLADRQVQLHALGRYYEGARSRDGLVFGYGAVDLPQIRRGLGALRRTLGPARRRRGSAPESLEAIPQLGTPLALVRELRDE
jgi:GntR family transcriptional regulator/MocR family aminotransferase